MIIELLLLVALSGLIYFRARASKVNHDNVNLEWEGTVTPAEPERAAAA